MVTAGILNAWLLPVLLLAAAEDAWVSMSLAKLGHEHFLKMAARNMRLYVADNLLVARDVAVERHALTLQQPLVGQQRRIS